MHLILKGGGTRRQRSFRGGSAEAQLEGRRLVELEGEGGAWERG